MSTLHTLEGSGRLDLTDDPRPVLITGHSGAGKTVLLRHLIATGVADGAGPVTVVAEHGTDFETALASARASHTLVAADRAVAEVDSTRARRDFLARAQGALAAAATSRGLLVVDEAATLIARHDHPVLDGLAEAVTVTLGRVLATAAQERLRVYLTTQAPSALPDCRVFGTRVLLGRPTPAAWSSAFGAGHPFPERVPGGASGGHGWVGVDGSVVEITVPWDDVQQGLSR